MQPQYVLVLAAFGVVAVAAKREANGNQNYGPSILMTAYPNPDGAGSNPSAVPQGQVPVDLDFSSLGGSGFTGNRGPNGLAGLEGDTGYLGFISFDTYGRPDSGSSLSGTASPDTMTVTYDSNDSNDNYDSYDNDDDY